jgi:hypothetical protein
VRTNETAWLGAIALASAACGSSAGPGGSVHLTAPDATSPGDVDASYAAIADGGGIDLGDAGSLGEAQAGDGGAETCNLGSAGSFATQQSLNLFGQIVYYENGQVLPAGTYRVAYVDGCMKYASYEDWAVQAIPPSDAFWLVGATSADKIIMPPGTVGYLVDAGPSMGGGGFATFDECVAANLMQDTPIDFAFDGGTIGVWLSDNPYSDNVAGVDGRNPKWSLTLLGKCPPIRSAGCHVPNGS